MGAGFAVDEEVARLESTSQGTIEALGPLDVSLHRGADVILRHAREWRALCDRADRSLAFLRPEIVAHYFDAFAPKDQAILLTAHRGAELVALLPLQQGFSWLDGIGIGWIRSAGNVHVPRFDALCIDDPEMVARAFWDTLRSAFPQAVMYFQRTPGNGLIHRMSRIAASEGRIVREHDPDGTPYIPVRQPPLSRDDLIAAQNKKLRSTLRRGFKRAEERGILRLVHAPPAGDGRELRDWFEAFCELEHRGWKGVAGTSILSDRGATRFYRSLVDDADLRPYVSLLALMVDGDMMAGDLGLFIDGVFHGLKVAFNEDYRDCSPGHLMQLYEILEFSRLGAVEVDLGGRVEQYKLFWTKEKRAYSSVLILPAGLRGRLLHALVSGVVLRGRDYLRSKPQAQIIRRGLNWLRSPVIRWDRSSSR